MDLLSGNIPRQLLRFFFPVLFGTLFQQLYNTVDAMVVGNFVGKEALGAVGGSTGTIINLLVGFVTGLSSGATVVIAQYYGEHNNDGVQQAVRSGMFLAIVLGAALTLIGLVFAPGMLRMLNVPEDIFSYSLVYMRIYFAGMLPTMLYNTGAGILRAVGDARRPLYFLIASCVTNIVLDIVFVAAWGWGIAGAAWATVISQLVSGVLTMMVLTRTDSAIRYRWRDFGFTPAILKNIAVIGLPTGIQSALYSVANLFIQASINSFGTDTVAAYTAFGKIDATFWNASGALGMAVLTFAGQNFGAGNIQRVKAGFYHAIAIYLAGSALIIGVCLGFGEYLFRLFTPDEEVIAIGLSILRFISPWWASFCLIEVFSSGIRACGDSLIPMLITAGGIGALRIIWIVCFPGETIFDTLVCFPVSWVVTSLLFLVYYLQGGWLRRSLQQQEQARRAAAMH
jgi:putative MATE family efflux protein